MSEFFRLRRNYWVPIYLFLNYAVWGEIWWVFCPSFYRPILIGLPNYHGRWIKSTQSAPVIALAGNGILNYSTMGWSINYSLPPRPCIFTDIFASIFTDIQSMASRWLNGYGFHPNIQDQYLWGRPLMTSPKFAIFDPLPLLITYQLSTPPATSYGQSWRGESW